jgi:hypothetical protein
MRLGPLALRTGFGQRAAQARWGEPVQAAMAR